MRLTIKIININIKFLIVPKEKGTYRMICHQLMLVVEGLSSRQPKVLEFLLEHDGCMQVVREIVGGVPNPFVIGEEGYRYYETQFYNLVKWAREGEKPVYWRHTEYKNPTGIGVWNWENLLNKKFKKGLDTGRRL